MFWTVTLPTLTVVLVVLATICKVVPRARAFMFLEDEPESFTDWSADEVDDLWSN